MMRKSLLMVARGLILNGLTIAQTTNVAAAQPEFLFHGEIEILVM
jgi:hypothetical protein